MQEVNTYHKTSLDIVSRMQGDSRELLSLLQNQQVECSCSNVKLNDAVSKIIGLRATLNLIESNIKQC